MLGQSVIKLIITNSRGLHHCPRIHVFALTTGSALSPDLRTATPTYLNRGGQLGPERSSSQSTLPLRR